MSMWSAPTISTRIKAVTRSLHSKNNLKLSKIPESMQEIPPLTTSAPWTCWTILTDKTDRKFNRWGLYVSEWVSEWAQWLCHKAPYFKWDAFVSHNNLSCFVDPVVVAYYYTPLHFHVTDGDMINLGYNVKKKYLLILFVFPINIPTFRIC